MSDKETIKLHFCKKCERLLGTENYYQRKGYCELRNMKGGNHGKNYEDRAGLFPHGCGFCR